MSAPDDGGPAFPVPEPYKTPMKGMTLRDWFAGQALGGSNQRPGDSEPQSWNWGNMANAAYQAADAMLAARKGGQAHES